MTSNIREHLIIFAGLHAGERLSVFLLLQCLRFHQVALVVFITEARLSDCELGSLCFCGGNTWVQGTDS